MHSKVSLCRASDEKRTAKIFTHGKSEFSRSVRRKKDGLPPLIFVMINA
jgi:hypothetical protein